MRLLFERRHFTRVGRIGDIGLERDGGALGMNGAEGQNRTGYAGLFRAALYR